MTFFLYPDTPNPQQPEPPNLRCWVLPPPSNSLPLGNMQGIRNRNMNIIQLFPGGGALGTKP